MADSANWLYVAEMLKSWTRTKIQTVYKSAGTDSSASGGGFLTGFGDLQIDSRPAMASLASLLGGGACACPLWCSG